MADGKNPGMEIRKSKSSSTKSDSGLRASLLAGSEEIFEYFCQPCATEHLHLEAVGYCQDCEEYMCGNCYNYHRKTTATRDHKLLEKADMPKDKMSANPTDHLKETCPKHKHKLLEYFCSAHSDLCCVICLKADHASCKLTSHIPVVSDGIDSSDEYKSLMTDLKALLSSVTKQKNMLDLSIKDNDKYQSQSLAGIREFRKEVDKLIDKYEENAVMKVSELHHANSEKIKAASTVCQGVLADVTAMIANLDTKAQDGKQNQLFVDVKLSKQRLSGMEAEAKDVTDCRITRYGFHQNEKIKAMISTLSAAWSLSIRLDGGETKARHLGEVNVKSDGDTNDCHINGMAVLPGGDIVVADFNNKSLKLVDMKLKKVTSRLSLSSPPFDVINTTQNEIAVSLGNEGKIEMYTVTDVLSLSNTVLMGETFAGIHYAGERFILTSSAKSIIKIVDMSGRVLSTISTDKNGDRLFTKPRYIAVGRGGDVIYVTDYEAHTLTTITLGGDVISVYRNDKLKHDPFGVTVGPDHKVYVCSQDTNTVLQLTATGEFQQVLLDKQRGLSVGPGAIAYDDTSDRLYISSSSTAPDMCNYVKFFQME